MYGLEVLGRGGGVNKEINPTQQDITFVNRSIRINKENKYQKSVPL
jgi:hypothetical protein